MKVFITGTFDLLHVGHIEILKKCRALSQDGYVVVALDGDERVRNRKGYGRPIIKAKDRQKMLEAVRYVDQVKIFHSDKDLLAIMEEYKPDIRVLGDDYSHNMIVGSEYGRVVQIPRSSTSTSEIIERVRS